MDYTSKVIGYEYIDRSSYLMFDSMEVKRGAKLSEYPVLANKLDYAVSGTSPKIITLKGRFLPQDFTYIYNYISQNVGKVLDTIHINTMQFNSVVILSADVIQKNTCFLGEMVMVIQTV